MKRKPIKVPQPTQQSLILDGFNVVDSCTNITGASGIMFLKEHLLLIVTKGTYVIRYGEQEYTIRENEIVLLRKAISIEYEKSCDPENNNFFEGMMFFLKDNFLKESLKKIDVSLKKSDEMAPVSVKRLNPQLFGFVQSLIPYFDVPSTIDDGLIKLKITELLYGISSTDPQLLSQLMLFKEQNRRDIDQVLEENYMNPVSINELAYLSGRSLSTFKRDFKAIYNMPPSRWLQKRRLKRAKELLYNTQMPVTDICYSTGFENLSHFSKVYKSHYGHSPSSQRSNLS